MVIPRLKISLTCIDFGALHKSKGERERRKEKD